ncbi:MAG: urea carboxylase-associated family protein [Acidobacteria bacterium]|nr:urea carboxylase-associated family protein [Acidobacteriota bacterium]
MPDSRALSDEVLWEEVVPPGAMWSHVLKRGTALRLTDIEGGANAGVILYNADNYVERYNMPDTLKAQHIARLTTGAVLYSDMGRILCSITHDSLGWHDPIGGCSNEALLTRKYGDARYQEHRNQCHRNGHDSFLIEISKYGMNERDLMPNVNLFSKVEVHEDGSMHFVPGYSRAGAFVELRAELNTLIVLNTCQHPMDPSATYAPKPVHLSIRKAAPASADDPCRLSRPENARGFTLTERYFL